VERSSRLATLPSRPSSSGTHTLAMSRSAARSDKYGAAGHLLSSDERKAIISGQLLTT
jgi:hypothetical protein